MVVSASKDGTAKFWSPLQPVESETLPRSDRPVRFSSDGARLITLNRDFRLHRWDTRNHEDLGAIGPILRDSTAWAVSDRGDTLAVAWSHGRIDVWNLGTDQLDKSFTQTNTRIARLAFSHDAVLLAVANETVGWSGRSGHVEHLGYHDRDHCSHLHQRVWPAGVLHQPERLVSTRLDGSVVVWDLSSGRSFAKIE